ncbi:MAG: 50S ribosomal protein L7 [Oscillospiraceae bacterium]|nr:50S ribosomal protein L7 [Oscillospiraceae bacterium]
MTDKTLSTLGLAYKAGRVIYGADRISREIGRCAGLLLASDAGAAAAREARFLADKAGLPLVQLDYPRETVGRAIGKHLCAVLAVTDKGLYHSITVPKTRRNT